MKFLDSEKTSVILLAIFVGLLTINQLFVFIINKKL